MYGTYCNTPRCPGTRLALEWLLDDLRALLYAEWSLDERDPANRGPRHAPASTHLFQAETAGLRRRQAGARPCPRWPAQSTARQARLCRRLPRRSDRALCPGGV